MTQVRILHIADVHLGGSGPAFGRRVAEHQQRIARAFARCVDWALHHQVAALCIAGDLFDSNRPTERHLGDALRELARLQAASPPIPCFILPGTHDCLSPAGVYGRPEFAREGLHVWREEGPASFRLSDGSLAVHGSPQICGQHQHSPLQGLQPDPSARFNVALAHGSVVIPGVSDSDGSLVRPEELAASGMDYVALGHWHQFSDQSVGGVCAAYSGSPEIIAVDRDPGGAVLVTLSDVGTQVECLSTAALRRASVALEAELHSDESSVADAIRAMGNPELLLEVTIRGLAPAGFALDIPRLQTELQDEFFRLRVRDDTVPAPGDLETGVVGEHLVAGRVVGMLQERIAQAESLGDEQAARIARHALQLAMALFAGREVLA